MLMATAWCMEAQEVVDVKNKIEVEAYYILQRPFYSVNNPIDILALPKDWRMRSAMELAGRYYLFNKIFVRVSAGFSQEGGGYKQRFTNADYLKSSIQLGYSSSHSKRMIFEASIGYETALLLGATFKDQNLGTEENVRAYLTSSYSGIPISLGLKTRLGKGLFARFGLSAHLGAYEVSDQSYISTAQIVSPAFRLGISKVIIP